MNNQLIIAKAIEDFKAVKLGKNGEPNGNGYHGVLRRTVKALMEAGEEFNPALRQAIAAGKSVHPRSFNPNPDCWTMNEPGLNHKSF